MTTKPRILLIDARESDRALASALLRDALPQADVVEVACAVEFAESFRQAGWSVVISEQELGWANGDDVLRLLKRRNPRCASVLFSQQAPSVLGQLRFETSTGGPDLYIKKVTAGYLNLVEVVERAIAASNPPVALTALAQRIRGLEDDIADLLDTSQLALPAHRSEVEALAASAKRMQSMFADRRAANWPTSYTEVDLKRAIRSAMWTLAKDLRRTQMRVRSARLPTVRADATGLHAFFRGLLAFAIRRANHKRVCATVRTRTRPNDWLLSFHLEGIKPSKSDLAHLLDGEPGQPDAGELAECARIAEQHGGNMWLEVGTDGSINFLASLRIEVIDPVEVEIHYNGQPVGQVSVTDGRSRSEITRAALSLPALSEDLTESTIKLVEFVQERVVNIVA